MISSTDQNAADRLVARVTELETLFTHLQQSVHDLDKVILDQQKQLDGLRGQLSRLMLQSDLLTETPPEPRRLEDEKPPHY